MRQELISSCYSTFLIAAKSLGSYSADDKELDSWQGRLKLKIGEMWKSYV